MGKSFVQCEIPPGIKDLVIKADILFGTKPYKVPISCYRVDLVVRQPVIDGKYGPLIAVWDKQPNTSGGGKPYLVAVQLDISHFTIGKSGILCIAFPEAALIKNTHPFRGCKIIFTIEANDIKDRIGKQRTV